MHRKSAREIPAESFRELAEAFVQALPEPLHPYLLK